MSKFKKKKKKKDKMTTNLAESFNACLQNEKHHYICNFLLEHMSKLGSMLVKHKEESNNWKGFIGPKIEDKVLQNIENGEMYPVTPFMNGVFGVCIGGALLNVDIINRTCTYRGWQMLGIPCEHVAAAIIFIGQNITNFINDYYNDDGLVRSITREVFFSLKPSHTKGLPEGQGRSALSPNFKINGRSIALVVICSTTTEKRARIICLQCISVTLLHCSDLVLPYLN